MKGHGEGGGGAIYERCNPEYPYNLVLNQKEIKMKKEKYLFVPVLVTLVVLVISLFPSASVTRKASAAPRAAVVTKYLMIPAAAFNVAVDGKDYVNYGHSVQSLSGDTNFVAPVYMPSGARIRSIKLFAYDANTNQNICASLNELHPKSISVLNIKGVCTTGSSGNQQPVKFLSHYVKWYYGYYIWLNSIGRTNLVASAVMIKYTVNQ
jgi:hypothetical protein